ncbi:MAG: FMN-binding negative transcriptional regulator [Bacteroidota bacterium]
MYIPSTNRWEDQEGVLAFMQRFSFASIINVNGSGLPLATHLPFVLDIRGEQLFLKAHFARANDQWTFLDQQTSLVVFSEPHAYVSPAHYNKKQNVPTWNYQAVHVYGQARVVEDGPTARAIVEDLIQQSEPGYLKQWKELSPAYQEAMFKGIVAFEMLVTDVQAKSKLSQNKQPEEQMRIAEELLHSADTGERYLGKEMLNQLNKDQP